MQRVDSWAAVRVDAKAAQKAETWVYARVGEWVASMAVWKADQLVVYWVVMRADAKVCQWAELMAAE